MPTALPPTSRPRVGHLALAAIIRHFWRTALALLASSAFAAPLDLRLPTENQHLFTGEPEKFYMYVPRTFEGVASQPWEGGQFGFVRTPVRINQDIVYTQFHEGIDIAPVKRDRAGNPLDLVNAIADGIVVHTSTVSGRSNYGKYVVIQHNLEGGAYFSVSAHLADITCRPGDQVKAGSAIGRMGYTGAGISRPRAHVHLELTLMLHSRYDDWHASIGSGTNYHGIYNGMNLIGLDIAALFLKHRENPNLSLVQFLRSTPVHFKVTVPRRGPIDLCSRNPWLLTQDQASPSWEIAFAAAGLPLAVAPSQKTVEQPTVTFTQDSPTPLRYLTRKLLNGDPQNPSLSPQGSQLIHLLTGNFPESPKQGDQLKPLKNN